MNNISNSNFLAAQSSPMMAELAEKELHKKLNLYQLFVKLYEHHSNLLDEILQLEDVSKASCLGVKSRYIQAVVDSTAIYLITNLADGKTHSLRQPQQIWTIGRDRSNGVRICDDQYVSRRHAAIRYIENQGFCLIDFNSTNGSYVNGEQIYQPFRLKDGDRLRIGSTTFTFYLTNTCQKLPTVAVELLMQLACRCDLGSKNSNCPKTKVLETSSQSTPKIFQHLETANMGLAKAANIEQQLTPHLKSEILDNFLSRHID